MHEMMERNNMQDTFAITIGLITFFTVVAAFIKGRCRDKCLKDFSHDPVILEEASGCKIKGTLRVENTGFEIVYEKGFRTDKGHLETSYLMYKKEYPNILVLKRRYDELDGKGKKLRDKELAKVYHPGIMRRLKRKVQNVFKTVRDSTIDVINVFIGQAKKIASVGAVMNSQEKYVSKLRQEMVSTIGTAYEPLLERYIGHKVIFHVINGDVTSEHEGVLKEYTAEFIEIMDTDYPVDGESLKGVDMVIPRAYGIVRHSGERR